MEKEGDKEFTREEKVRERICKRKKIKLYIHWVGKLLTLWLVRSQILMLFGVFPVLITRLE